MCVCVCTICRYKLGEPISNVSQKPFHDTVSDGETVSDVVLGPTFLADFVAPLMSLKVDEHKLSLYLLPT